MESPETILGGALDRAVRERGGGPAVDGADGATDFSTLAASAAALARPLAACAGARIALRLTPDPAGIAALVALERLGAHAFLVRPDLPVERIDDIVASYRLAGTVDPAAGFAPAPDARPHDGTATQGALVTLLTSGTTGRPKAVEHTWTTLSRPVRRDPRFAGSRWMLTYPLHLYAGLQVFLQCFLNAGTLVVRPLDAAPADLAADMAGARVAYVSATPSFWRRLFRFGDPEALRRVPLRQATLGGEPVTADVLTLLHEAYPEARIVHIYATSELGRCFAVGDGRTGFPARFLEEPPEPGVALRIVDGELEVRSENRMRRYDPLSPRIGDAEGWFPTGDLVEVVDDRVEFRGRRSDMINVGGNKVHPIEVEVAILEVAGVAEVRVHPVASSLVGEMVAAQIVPAPGVDPAAVRRAVAAHCAGRLLPYQRPRQIEVVDRLDLTGAGKIARRREEEA